MRLLLSGGVGLPMISFEPLELVRYIRARGKRGEGQGERYEELDSGLHYLQRELRVLIMSRVSPVLISHLVHHQPLCLSIIHITYHHAGMTTFFREIKITKPPS